MSRFPSWYVRTPRPAAGHELSRISEPGADDDGTDKYTPTTYSLVRPSTLHTGAVAAEEGVRLLRYASRGFMGGAGGSGGGTIGSGAGFGNVNYNRAITGTPAEFIGPSVAPTAFQSIRGGVNQIGIRGGAMVAEIGLRSLAQTTGALAEEDAAANGVNGSDSATNAEAYQRAEAKEYSGVVGGIRHFLHGSTADDAALAAAIEADRTSQREVATAQRAGQTIGRDRDEQRRTDEGMGERTAEASVGSRDERERMHSAFTARRELEANDKRFDEVEAAIAAETPGSHSDPRYQARIAAVEKERKSSDDAARQAEAAEDAQRDRERDQRVGGLNREATADRMELSGDARGAERARLDNKLDQEQAAADARSPAEGNAFRAVADAERAELAQKQQRELADRLDQTTAETRAGQLDLAGDAQGADRVRLEARLKREQQEADRRGPQEGEAFKTEANVERATFDDRQQREGDRDKLEMVDRVTDADQEAAEAAARAKGDTYEADAIAFERAQDRKAEKIRELLAVTTDANDRAKLQFELGLTQNVGGRERQARADQHAREDHEATDDVRTGTAAAALRGSGQGAEADELQRLRRDDEEIRRAERDHRPEDVAALRDRRQYDQQDAEYQRQREQRDRDRHEEDAHYRATGQGAMADYNDLRDREQDDIDTAKRSGDPKRVAQAKRTAADEITAWANDHRDPAQTFDSVRDFDRHIMLGDANSHGLAGALGRAGTDVKALNGGNGDLSADNRTAAKMDDAAGSLAAVAAKLEEMFDNAPKLYRAG